MKTKIGIIVAGMAMFGALAHSAQAAEVEGRSGNQPGTGAIDLYYDWCNAAYDTPHQGNYVVGGAAESVKIVSNKNMTKVTCKFTDTSGVFEDNAETIQLHDCGYWDAEDISLFHGGGSGHLTAAANNGEYDGGNVTLTCFIPNES